MLQDDGNASSSIGDRFKFDEARNIIDCDIARLEETLRALKSRRNELSPIHRLPPEILCNIFSFIEDRTMGQILNPERWIKFSQVSQHWRSLALSAPELWANIPFNYPRWAEEMLRRSQMAKLMVQVDLDYLLAISKDLNPIQSCLSQMMRIGEIDISTAMVSTLEKLFQDLPKSAPQLHTFRIKGYSFPGPTFTIPEKFLTDTERLQYVHLVECKIGWDSPLLTGLTRLTLHDCLKDDASTIQFLHALQRMPALTNLDLEDSIPYNYGEIPTYLVVDLPCLRVLRILSDVGAATNALHHITFPSSVALSLSCKETHPTQIDLKIISVLATKFLSSLVIRSLSVTYFHDVLRLQAWSTAVQEVFQDPPSRLDLTLTWPNTRGPQNPAKVLTAVFDSMILRALTHLQLSTSDAIGSKTWVQTSTKLPLLEWVHVASSAAAHTFLTALVHKTKAADKSIAAYRTVCFPRLRRIRLDSTDFARTNLDSISVDMLKACLMERCERNAEVQELSLTNCYGLSEKDVEGLREIVVDVEWDELEQIFSESEEERDYDSDGITYDYDDYYD